MRLLRPAAGGSRAARARRHAGAARGPIHFGGRDRRRARRLAGLPAGRAPADVRAARPPRGLPGDAGGEPALPVGRDRAPAGDPGRSGARERPRARGERGRAGDPSPAPKSSPGSASTPARRPLRGRWRPGQTSPYRAIGVYIGGANRACSQPNLTSAWVERTGRRGLAPDPDLRRPAGADQRLRELRQAELQPDQATAQGTEEARRRGRRRAERSAWARAARSTSTWRPTRAPRARPRRR